METENETAPFHVPQELTFEYLNYLYWGVQYRFAATNIGIAFPETSAEGGCVVKCRGVGKPPCCFDKY